LMAAAVWTAIRLLRVQAGVAQKIAWVMVLAAAGAMPLVMHSPWLTMNQALKIPVQKLSFHPEAPQPAQTSSLEARFENRQLKVGVTSLNLVPRKAKPSAAH